MNKTIKTNNRLRHHCTTNLSSYNKSVEALQF